jgi:hypothetical protein
MIDVPLGEGLSRQPHTVLDTVEFGETRRVVKVIRAESREEALPDLRTRLGTVRRVRDLERHRRPVDRTVHVVPAAVAEIVAQLRRLRIRPTEICEPTNHELATPTVVVHEPVAHPGRFGLWFADGPNFVMPPPRTGLS